MAITVNDHFKTMQTILTNKTSDDMTIQDYKELFHHLMAIANATDDNNLTYQMAANASVLLAAIVNSHHYEANVITNIDPNDEYKVKLTALPEKDTNK